ncbi:MAG: methionyl-tRNA formyltransferase [Desulfobacterales bacterium]|jgi:methionyl-tRNA formyltransferase
MGTPKFAVPALNTLCKSNQNVVLVVTQPDRPKGRGRKVIPPPVKEVAINLRYKVDQPSSVRTVEFANRIANHKPDIIVVVAFGQIIPKNILATPKIAAINLHASLLPKYRGPAPIQWAIINGETETGVTSMLLDEGLDTGDILMSSKIKIFSDDTSGTLHDRLANLSADVLIQTIERIGTGDITPISQDHSQATYAPLLKKNDGRMNWEMPAQTLEAFIRGMTPWPGAFTFHGKKRLKIFKAVPAIIDTVEPPGTVIRRFPDELYVATGKGALSVIEIQGESGKRLLIKEFLQGYKIPPGTILN